MLIGSLFLSGCDAALLNPKGHIGQEERTLILTALGLMLIVVIPVIIMAVLFSLKFREGSNEAIVWGIPILIILTLGTITWKTTHSLDPYRPLESDKKPVVIEVISLDWKWLFIYPEQGIATVNEVAFPKNTPVEFRITSNTVMNSFFIPQLGSQIYAMAGMQTKLHLIADTAGEYKGISSSYSGAGFSGMKFTAIATPDEASFNQWVDKVKQSPNTLDNMASFNKLAAPSQFHQVEYFSSANPGLYGNVIAKFANHNMPAALQASAASSAE
jgi:cytochrome o ubiquinol oxidase subunit II